MGKDEKGLALYLRTYKNITTMETKIPTVKLAIKIQDEVIFNDAQPLGIDQFPMVPVFSYYTPHMSDMSTRIQGVVRGLRDVQYIYNHRKLQEFDIMESRTNSGYIYKEDSLVDPLDIYKQIGQGKGIAIKKEAQMSDVIQIQAPPFDTALFQASASMADLFGKISGVNEELMGSATDDKAGILSMLRQGAGLTTLQILFDHLDAAQKILGKVMMETIRCNFTPGKIQKILEGQRPAPLFYSEAFGTYGCAVEEGLNTTTQKQLELSQRLQLREAGIPISDEDIMDVTTMQGKKKIMENMQKATQMQQQMQQEAHQMAMAEIQSKIKASDALATANQGLGVERLSRVEENEALAIERRAAAEKDHDTALLNLVKALKEIDGLDLEHVEKLMALSALMKTQQPDTQVKPSEFEGQPMQETASVPAPEPQQQLG
jgi:hypothetical protein